MSVLLSSRRSGPTRLVITVSIAAAAALIAFGVGADLLHAVLVGCTVVIFGSLLLWPPDLPQIHWPVRDDIRHDGSRLEVSRLSWTMVGRDNRVSPALLHRLHEVAKALLAEQGLDIDGPDQQADVERLLGPLAFRVLITNRDHPPRYDHFVACVGELEKLDRRHSQSAHPPPHPSESAVHLASAQERPT